MDGRDAGCTRWVERSELLSEVRGRLSGREAPVRVEVRVSEEGVESMEKPEVPTHAPGPRTLKLEMRGRGQIERYV